MDCKYVADDGAVGEQEARAELQRLLSDPTFHCTERNKNFLSFVVDEYFSGRAEALKAYAIAVDVFGRANSFDPVTDPIVRIEATRLRAALANHYQFRGADGQFRIELPKGRYVPTFSRAFPSAGALAENGQTPHEARKTLAGPAAHSPFPGLLSHAGVRWLALTTGLLAAILAGAFWFQDGLGGASHPAFSNKPHISIDMKMAGDASDIEAVQIRDALMIALSQFQTLRVASAEFQPTVDQSELLQTASIGADPRRESNYRVILKYQASDVDRSVWWQVVDTKTGEALRSGSERVFLDAPGRAKIAPSLITGLATRFGGTRGVIFDIETTRELAEPSLGNGCVVRSVLALAEAEPTDLNEVRACLEKTLLAEPNDADAQAALAIVLLEIDPPEAPTALTRRALDLANRSVVLAPMSDRSGFAQMAGRFRNGEIEASIAAGYRAMTLNPNNGAIPAKLGSILFTVGRWEQGVALVIRAGQIESAPYTDGEVTLAFDAYRLGQYDEALLRIQQMGKSTCYCVNVLRAAALGQLGRKQESALAVTSLRQFRPGIEASFRSDMAARRFAPALTASLHLGLIKAGMQVQ